MKRSLKNLFGANRLRKRYQFINYFVRTRGYHSYLEIGSSSGRCIGRIRCTHRAGVDPRPRAQGKGWELHEKTSDEFFASNRRRFEIIFIDGLHLAEQVLTDILNGLAALRPQGVILVHDCNPPAKESQFRSRVPGLGMGWHGDVWKAIAFIRAAVPQLFCYVLKLDQGIGVICPRRQNAVPPYSEELAAQAGEFFRTTAWEDLERGRAQMLGLIEDRASLEETLRREKVPPMLP